MLKNSGIIPAPPAVAVAVNLWDGSSPVQNFPHTCLLMPEVKIFQELPLS